MPVQPEAFFLPVESEGTGRRFCLYYPAVAGPAQGLVLYVHPFAEEMNKSRRMAALQTRALANAGYAVLQIDLQGCGDSSGDFGDATWQAWVSGVVLGSKWLRQRTNTQNTDLSQPPLCLWGLRSGCLLAPQAATQLKEPWNFLFWQPPSAGKTLLQQFLRLKVAGDMLGVQSRGVMDAMRQELAAGKSEEAADYMSAPGLTTGFEGADLSPPMGASGTHRLEWFEVSTRIGLHYFDLKNYDQALTQAHKALVLGFTRTELRDQLQAVGKWSDPQDQPPLPTLSATPVEPQK